MPRTVDIWLPAGYDEHGDTRYPVLYMHDGQNLFDDALSYSGVAWGVDRVVERMVSAEEMRAPILVGIWNTAQRIPEYMPQRPLEMATTRPAYRERFASTFGGAPCSDDYLSFIVTELKPFIDTTYRTLEGRKHTFVMGSSMGGLVSLYAVCEYPQVFSGAACLSTSWTVAGPVLMPYLERHLPDPAEHRLYFDHGSEAQIAAYERHQRQVETCLVNAGYTRTTTWASHRYPGAPHSEQAWKARVDVPLRFLLGT